MSKLKAEIQAAVLNKYSSVRREDSPRHLMESAPPILLLQDCEDFRRLEVFGSVGGPSGAEPQSPSKVRMLESLRCIAFFKGLSIA